MTVRSIIEILKTRPYIAAVGGVALAVSLTGLSLKGLEGTICMPVVSYNVEDKVHHEIGRVIDKKFDIQPSPYNGLAPAYWVQISSPTSLSGVESFGNKELYDRVNVGDPIILGLRAFVKKTSKCFDVKTEVVGHAPAGIIPERKDPYL